MSGAVTWGPSLARAYIDQDGSVSAQVRVEVVTRELEALLARGSARVLDIGGGQGLQTLALARRGHRVVLVDSDDRMLGAASERLAGEAPEVRRRVRLRRAPGEAVRDLGLGTFDLVLCHSVLMYLDTQAEAAVMASVAGSLRPNGLASVLCLNRSAIAARSALRGDWSTAAAILAGDGVCGRNECLVRAHTPEELIELYVEHGLRPLFWSGVKIFVESVDAAAGSDYSGRIADICRVEWLARRRDPYRGIARLIHIVGRRMCQTRLEEVQFKSLKRRLRPTNCGSSDVSGGALVDARPARRTPLQGSRQGAPSPVPDGTSSPEF